MKSVVIISKNRELGMIVADIVDDYKHGDVDGYRDLYDSDMFEVISVNIVERLYMSLS